MQPLLLGSNPSIIRQRLDAEQFRPGPKFFGLVPCRQKITVAGPPTRTKLPSPLPPCHKQVWELNTIQNIWAKTNSPGDLPMAKIFCKLNAASMWYYHRLTLGSLTAFSQRQSVCGSGCLRNSETFRVHNLDTYLVYIVQSH